jgi:hypothetical protein
MQTLKKRYVVRCVEASIQFKKEGMEISTEFYAKTAKENP